jgi:hypothetical protein
VFDPARSRLFENHQQAKAVNLPRALEQTVFQNHVNRAQAIFPPHFLSLRVGSRTIGDSDLLNPAAKPAKLGDKLCITPNRFSRIVRRRNSDARNAL